MNRALFPGTSGNALGPRELFIESSDEVFPGRGGEVEERKLGVSEGRHKCPLMRPCKAPLKHLQAPLKVPLNAPLKAPRAVSLEVHLHVPEVRSLDAFTGTSRDTLIAEMLGSRS